VYVSGYDDTYLFNRMREQLTV